MDGVRVVRALEVWLSEHEPYAPIENARKGTTAYPFAEMQVGGMVVKVRGRTLGAVRDAIKRFVKVQKAKDSKFKRRYAARLGRDEKGEVVTVWRLS